MDTSLLEDLKSFLEARNTPLIDTRRLADGTTEFAFEPQQNENGLCLIRLYQLPSDNPSN